MDNGNVKLINTNEFFVMISFALAYLIGFFCGKFIMNILVLIIFFWWIMAKKSVDKLLKYFFCIVFFNAAYINAILIWTIFCLYQTKNNIKKTKCGVKVFVFLFLVATFISGLFSNNLTATVKELIMWVYVLGVVLCCQYTNDLQGVFKSYILSCILISVFWIMNSFQLWMPQNINNIYIPDDNNSSMILLCGIFLIRYLKSVKNKRILIVSCEELLLIAGIFIIGSRGIQVLTIVFYINVLIKNIKYKKAICTLLIFLFIMGIFLPLNRKILIFESIIQLSKNLLNSKVYSNRVRLEMYKVILLEMLPNYFFFGVGPGNFINIYTKYAIDFIPNHAHSIYLQILIEDGIFAFFILNIFILYLICFFVKGLKKNHKNLSKYSLCFLSVFLIYGIVEFVWNNSNVLAVFSGIMLISENYQKLQNFKNRSLCYA